MMEGKYAVETATEIGKAVTGMANGFKFHSYVC